MAKKVVPGSLTNAYKKREGDFSPDLVGFQFTKSSSVFTLGNFSITTNTEPLTGQVFNTGEFSDPITLDNLDLTLTESEKIESTSNSLSVKLKNNKSNFLSYVYFGNSTKFLETEINDIIVKWKGSLYLRQSTINDTVVDFNYNTDKDTSSFKTSINIVNNVFGLETSDTDEITFDQNDISILSQSFTKYEVYNDYGTFNLIGYTGNSVTDDYITVEVNGNAWPTLSSSTAGSFSYHIKPNDTTLDETFFSDLSDFQNELLNRLITPKYTLTLEIPYQNSLGYTIKSTTQYTWPTGDGYNIDISGRDYAEYLEKLFDTIRALDTDSTNIMVRKLISSCILGFDTEGQGTTETGRKMDKLLKIWGREYDEVKRYIDGISFANVVTYDGKDNMPDELVKILANNLGFDTIQSFSDNDLINYLVTTSNAIFEGNSRSESIEELDTELWRRLVINAWWLFKSKGTRKVVEFFLNLFQIDECLVDLDECVYLVESKLDYLDVITRLNSYYGVGFFDIDDVPIDTDGYPKILPNSIDYYFQMDGFWYDGGVPANTKPDTNGNNPHYGPYDFGRAYFDKFRCFIDDFEPVTNTVNLNELTFNYFTDYSSGTVEGIEEETITIGNDTVTNIPSGHLLTNYNQFYGDVMDNTDRITIGNTVNNAGKSDEQSNTGGSSFKINFTTGTEEECRVCPNNIRFNGNGQIFYDSGDQLVVLTDEVCCDFYGYDSYFDNSGGGTTSCYWCAPEEYFIEQIIPITTTISDNELFKLATPTKNVISYQTPSGEIKTPTKDCCLARGHAWDNVNNLCVPRKPIVITDDDGSTTISDVELSSS